MCCSLCISHRAFLCPVPLHAQWLPGAKLLSLRNFLFDVDIKRTNPEEFRVFLCMREGVFFGSGQAKEIPLQLSSLPFISRFAPFDERDNQCEKWEEKAKSQTPALGSALSLVLTSQQSLITSYTLVSHLLQLLNRVAETGKRMSIE